MVWCSKVTCGRNMRFSPIGHIHGRNFLPSSGRVVAQRSEISVHYFKTEDDTEIIVCCGKEGGGVTKRRGLNHNFKLN